MRRMSGLGTRASLWASANSGRRWSKLKSFPIGGSVWITLADRLLLAHLHRSNRMNFPQREALGLALHWITSISVHEVKIVVKQAAFDQEHFPAQRADFARCPVRGPILWDHLDNDSFKLAAVFRCRHGYV